MNKVYCRLMKQQHLSPHIKQAIYDHLQQVERKPPRPIYWKAAIVALCILLLIPVSVYAIENIFGVVIIQDRSKEQFPALIGYDIVFEDVQPYPVEAFAENLQALKEDQRIYYSSWENAEAELGIALLDNPILTDTDTQPIGHYLAEHNDHCYSYYRTLNGQLYSTGTVAAYQRKNVAFELKTMVSAQHPARTEKTETLTAASIAYLEEYNPNIVTEKYTTKNSIPVTIITAQIDSLTEHSAAFAVNDICYQIRVLGANASEMWQKEVLLEVLDGFVLE